MGQQLCADMRMALVGSLEPATLWADSEREMTIRRGLRFDLKGRFSLFVNFASDEEVRDRARDTASKVMVYFVRAGRADPANKHHAAYPQHVVEAKKGYGEAHYALDRLVEVLGGPEAPPREGYFFALDSDP